MVQFIQCEEDMLLKGISYGTKNSIAYILPKERVINIDEKIDFEFAKFLIESKKKMNKSILITPQAFLYYKS